MNALLTIVFAGIAAVGNALFALGQKQASNAGNGLLFVGASAGVACVLALLSSPFLGPVTVTTLIRSQGRPILLCGVGLFLTYLGFNLLYTRFGASAYIVYASMAIVTTSVGVGFLYLREPMTGYHVASLLLAAAAIVLFAIGQTKV